jgi:lysozyme family protein
VTGNFAPSLAHVLASEGGFVDDPRDNGGATNKGVTQSVYDHWRRIHNRDLRSVETIDPNEVEAIYRKQYWDAVSGDNLPSGVDYCTFDYAVNSGPIRACKALQRAAGVDDDGQIGPVTLSAVNSADPRRIICAISADRLSFMERQPAWAHFGNGWSHRVATVEQVARGMA